MNRKAFICSIAGCDRKHYARSWCKGHYSRWSKKGVLDKAPIKPKYGATCRVGGCDESTLARGWCRTHYKRWEAHGDPTVLLQAKGSGDDVGYDAAHRRVRVAHGSAVSHSCVDCGQQAAHWAYDHLDPDERREQELPYSVKIEHYQPMCVRCHKRFDLARAA